MKVLLLLGFLVLGQVDADETSWSTFQIKHHKIYKNLGEQQLRQKIFNENLEKIKEHNTKYEQGLVSYSLGVNKFADLTEEEFAAKYATLQKVDEKILQNGIKKYDLTKNESKNELPESIDWRSKSVVTEVKNQGTCGSCWAFSATGTIESQLAIQTGELKSLSEQQLLDCNIQSGCNGGVVQYAIDYITKNGITLESSYQYQGEQQSCSSAKSRNKVVWTKAYVNINSNDEADLKQAVGLVGPVSVAIDASTISLYKDGIFNGPCTIDVNHAVLAVGYGIDNTTGTEYWIIKNSWGKDWGDQGYMKLRKGTNLCGVARQACYPVLGPNSGYSVKGGVLLYLMIFICLLLY